MISLYLIAVVQSVYYYRLLPEKVAVHYGASGVANSWGNRQFLVMFNLATITVLLVLFVAISLLVKHIPDYMINLPNKEYWLSNERRKKTLSKIQNISLAMGSATIVLLLVIIEIVYLTNIRNTSGLIISPFMPLALYIVYVIRLLNVFNKK